MTSSDPIAVLNGLLQKLRRSLPSYLADTRLQIGRGPEDIHQALTEIAAEQNLLAEEVAKAIRRLGGTPDYGRFPIEFTGINDVTLSFLAGEVVRLQQLQTDPIARAAAQLEDHPAQQRLAERIGETFKAQSRLLEERLDVTPSGPAKP